MTSASKILALIRRFIVLTCITMFCYAAGIFGSGLAPLSMLSNHQQMDTASSVDPCAAFLGVLIFSLAIALVFGYVILRSSWYGLKLALSVCIRAAVLRFV